MGGGSGNCGRFASGSSSGAFGEEDCHGRVELLGLAAGLAVEWMSVQVGEDIMGGSLGLAEE